MRLYVLALAAVMALLCMPAIAAPDSRCARATGADEIAICRSPRLSALDVRMRRLFEEVQSCTAMGGKDVNRDGQADWLARRSVCGGRSACLTKLYRARIAELAPAARKARRFLKTQDCPAL